MLGNFIYSNSTKIYFGEDSLQISHLRLPEWYKSTNCCLNSSVYLRGFLFCFVSVILTAPLLIGFILYDLKKSVQFIVTYPNQILEYKVSTKMIQHQFRLIR